MIERVVENWLTSVRERGFEVPFTQMLIAEGYLIIQGPTHHAYEHGKDILAFSPEGELCAFQTKSADSDIDIQELEKHQGQLIALAAAAVMHASVQPPRCPERVYFVTNRRLSAPARDRLSVLTLGNLGRGLGSIEPVEREQLLSRLVGVHQRWFPVEPANFASFLELYLNTGRDPLPKMEVGKFVETLLPFQENLSKLERSRALSSAALLVTYATSGWQRSENHLAVAEGWLIFSASVLRFAEFHALEAKFWRSTYDLAMQIANGALLRLIDESLEGDDLVVPDMTDGIFYGTRALLVCGYAAAYLVSQSQPILDPELRDKVSSLLKRELPYLFILGEVAAPFLFAIAWGFGALGQQKDGESILFMWARLLATRNRPDSGDSLPDPYHSFEELLETVLLPKAESGLSEQYDGHAYTLNTTIEWLARRWLRQHLASIWSGTSQIQHCAFTPSTPDRYLSYRDEEGKLEVSMYPNPQSWRDLLLESGRLRKASIPAILWERTEFLPFLPLIYPHRFTSDIAKAIDAVFRRKCEVIDDIEPPA